MATEEEPINVNENPQNQENVENPEEQANQENQQNPEGEGNQQNPETQENQENPENEKNDEEEESEIDMFGIKNENFQYPEGYREKHINDVDLPNKLCSIYEIIGQDANKRYNFHFLNDNEILLAIANTFQIFNIETKERKIFFSTEIGGVGVVTIHPVEPYFAVGECGNFPNIYIYKYEDGNVKLYRILRKGTETQYSALTFIEKGDLLASVGYEPDYNLVIWNWRQENIILKAKAFSQEIYKVSFSDNFEGKLITSGMGHIRFWEMAKTFTGLKLQGEIGKFGQIDLSDISSFVEFPDGKVLCGTEHGTFLLWEGIFIKANLTEPENKKIHEGLVEHMSWEDPSADAENKKIMSAAHDGLVKWWKYLDIENVVLDDNSNGVIEPLRTVTLKNPETKKNIKIINLVKHNDFWLVQDGNGYLLKITPNESEEFTGEIINSFNSGPITKVTIIPDSPLVISQGSDRKLGIFSFSSNMKEFPEKILLEDPAINFNLKPTICDIPKRDNLDDPFISCVGYENGLIKIFYLNPVERNIDIIHQSRPHENAILCLKFSPDSSYLVSSTKNEIFIFLVESFDKIVPWCCIKEEQNNIVDIDWHPNSKKILVGFTNGTIDEIEIPLQFDKSKTFILTEYNKRTFKIKLAENQIEKMDEKKRQRLKEAGKLKEEPEPGSIFSCRYINLYEEGDFLVTTQKPFADNLYLCTFNFSETNTEQRPVNFWKLPPDNDYYIKHISKNFVFIVSHEGAVQIRNRKLLDKYVEIFPNLPNVQITDINTSNDEKFVCISFQNGINTIYQLDVDGFNEYIEMFSSGKMEMQDELNEKLPPKIGFQKVDIKTCIEKLKAGEFVQIDLNDEKNVDVDKMLSLENDKQAVIEKEKERIADEKREKLFTRINKLRDDFKNLKEMNEKLPEEIRLTPDEMAIDNKYLEIVEKEKEENLEDVENKYNWLKANVNVMINKIEKFFLSSIETNKVTVFSFRTNENVSTIRCPSLPDNFEENLNKLETELKDFQKKIDFDSLLPKYLPLTESNTISEETERKRFFDLIETAQNRLQSQETKKSAKQSEIEPEIEETKGDVKAIKELLDSKLDLKRKIFEREEKNKNKKNKKINQINSTRFVDTKINRYGKCPEIYNLKMKYDRGYNEKTMLTTSRQKKKIFEYLKLLFKERQNFNQKVLELKNKKIEIMNKLKEYKIIIDDYNKILRKEENYDWFNFENKDSVQDLMKIPEEELKNYMNKKIETDEKLKKIFEEENNNNNNNNTENENDEIEWDFVVKERSNKNSNHTNLETEFDKLNDLKYGFKKEKLLKEINNLIDEFDNELEELKNLRNQVSFYQKLGEYELLLKHKELNKLRAFDNEDKKFCDKLVKMFDEYTANLENLKRNHGYMEENKRELKKQEDKKREKELAFEKLIENERENREQLIKIFHQRKKEPSKDQNGDDKIDQEEELNMPKSITNQVKHEIYQLKNGCEYFEVEIQRYTNKIEDNKRKMNTDIKTKEALDDKRFKLIDKIRQNEKQKEQYINQIELALPVALDQFKKIDPVEGKTLIELGKAIYITRAKLQKLNNDLNAIERSNNEYEIEERQFTLDFDNKLKEKKNNEKNLRENETVFKNEQILKFGLEIDFDFLLTASKKTTFDRYENEYKKLKAESDRKIDVYKQKIEESKRKLQLETNKNTNELKEIKRKLEEKQGNDKKLEEKNSEITKKNNKKYQMYDLSEKKQKLKEILKLLKQQMDALKKEIDIFRRKGGHIYSTIASNLV